MENEIVKLFSRMYHNKTLWIFLLSIITAIVALWATQSNFGMDGSPRAVYFLCFCVSFSAYQIVAAINKNAESLSNTKSVKQENANAFVTKPAANTCKHCGKPLIDGAKFCMYCGNEQNQD